MEFNKIVSVQGQPGLYETLNVRGDGLIVRSLDGGKANFVSSRNAGFSLLENISIYTATDAEPLKDVFLIIAESKIDLPDVKKADNAALKAFFKKVLPEYDEDQVYMSDIKKVIKWYNILDEKEIIKDMLEAKNKPKEEEKEEGKKEKKETKKKTAEKKAPAKKDAKKATEKKPAKDTKKSAAKTTKKAAPKKTKK